jgi:hypothetical protein
MPWRECSVTEERLRFVARLLEGEGMSAEELQHTLADIRAYRAAVNAKQIEREAGAQGARRREVR